MVHMNTRMVALGLGGICATALVGWMLVSGAKPPHAQSAAVAAAPVTVGQGTSAQAPSQATPAPQMAVASAPSSTPTSSPATTAAKKPQVKYAQNPQVKAKTRKVKRRAKVQRTTDAGWPDFTDR
jgi:mannose/fructose/N-acetylgalactosamine-specific phosphotransferase system component IIC